MVRYGVTASPGGSNHQGTPSNPLSEPYCLSSAARKGLSRVAVRPDQGLSRTRSKNPINHLPSTLD